MRILFCETFDDGTVGGSHACMYNLIRHSDRSAFDFTVGMCRDNSYVPRYEALGVEVLRLPPRRPVHRGPAVLRKLRNWHRLEFRLQRWLEGYLAEKTVDLVALNNSIFVSIPYVRACKRAGVPVVVYERGIGRLWNRHLRAAGEVNASVPISRAVADHITGRGYRPKLMEVIYDGIDPNGFGPTKSAARIKSELGLPSGGRAIGMVGNLRPWKGQRYFVEALLELAAARDDLYGLIIGDCSEEDRVFEASLRRRVADAGMTDRIRFLGYRDDVVDLLSILDVFVHASVKPEPFGMVLLEAMAARRPVVATRLGGPLEILDGGACGLLVPPEDAGAIVRGCEHYLDDPHRTRETVERAYSRLLRNFHIRKTVEQTAELFRRIGERRVG